jgi:hypothetical protein
MFFTAVRKISPLAQSPTSLISPSVFAANVSRFLRAASIISVLDLQVVVIVASHEMACSQPFLMKMTHSPPSHCASPVAQALPVSTGSFATGSGAVAFDGGAGIGADGGGGAPAAQPSSAENAMVTTLVRPHCMRASMGPG